MSTAVAMNLPIINILGTKVAAIDMGTAVDAICGWLGDADCRRYVCVVDVHCIMQSHRRPEVRKAYNSADLCVPDGMPLTWTGRLRGYRGMNRVYGPDLMLNLLERSASQGLRNFFFGGAEGVAESLKRAMESRFPGLNVVGVYCPPWRPLNDDEQCDLIALVDAARPDLMWIGLGAPKQDLFMADFQGLLRSKVMIGVGAAFDFHTGRVPQAPRWMMRAGLEWLFRLSVEPRRLAPRYFRYNPAFIWHSLQQLTGIRRYPD